jgi:RNA polymerase sigma factor (sigma-70 family)
MSPSTRDLDRPRLVSIKPSVLAETAEVLVVGLARTGDRAAFSELVHRRQAWVRGFMRRCSADVTLADDLSQQVFLQMWKDLRRLRDPKKFAGWLKRLALNVWLQHLRRHDALKDAVDDEGLPPEHTGFSGLSLDLDRALASLQPAARLCIVLSYHEGLSHQQIADAVSIPLGSVKSHIKRGTVRLQDYLSAYTEQSESLDD